MGKIESIAPADVRLWLVVDGDGSPLQIFKGSAADAEANGKRSYPLRADVHAVEAVTLWETPEGAAKLQFAATLAFVEWVATQFAMLQQMQQGAIQRVVPGVPPVPSRH